MTKRVPEIRFEDFTDDWEQRKVFDMSEITFGGGTPKTGNEDYWQGNFPWIQSSDLNNDQLCNVIPTKFITDEAINKSATKAVPANSIAVVTRVGVGKLALMPYPYATSQDFLSLSNLKVNPWFGVYSLYVLIQKEINNIQGTSIKGMTKSDLLSKNINIPFDLDEQTKIGNFFKQLDDTITLHQRKLEQLQSMKDGFLQKMFPKDGEKEPEIRFYGFTDDWEQRNLGQTDTYFTDGNYGEAYPSANDMSTKENGGIPFLRGSNFLNGYLDETNANYIKKEKHYELTSGHIQEDDIILAVRGSLGTLGYATKQNVGWNINSQLAIVRTKKSEIWGMFLTQYLLSHKGQKEMFSRITGTALKQLPIKQLKAIPIPIPDISEQQKIGTFLKKIDDTITLHQRELELLKQTKKAFLQKIFV